MIQSGSVECSSERQSLASRTKAEPPGLADRNLAHGHPQNTPTESLVRTRGLLLPSQTPVFVRAYAWRPPPPYQLLNPVRTVRTSVFSVNDNKGQTDTVLQRPDFVVPDQEAVQRERESIAMDALSSLRTCIRTPSYAQRTPAVCANRSNLQEPSHGVYAGKKTSQLPSSLCGFLYDPSESEASDLEDC